MELQCLDAPILKSMIASLNALDQRRITPPLMEENVKEREREREREREKKLVFKKPKLQK